MELGKKVITQVQIKAENEQVNFARKAQVEEVVLEEVLNA